MKKKLVSIVALLVLAALLALTLTGCGEKKTSITVFNCFDYIDEDVLKMFEEETGIKVNYVCFTTLEEMYA